MKNKHEVEKHSKCPHCDYHAPNNSKIHVHIDGHHAELYEKQFDCNHCARCFIWETSLKSHLTKHRIRKQLACKYCSAKVSTFPELDNHVIEVHQMPINTLAGKTVPLDVDLDLQIPNDVKQKVFCELCNLEFDVSGYGGLKRHMYKEHASGKQCYNCPHCERKFKTWAGLRVHIDGCHPDFGEKKILCDLCGKGFNFKESCIKHKITNHQKKFCDVCGMECFNKESWKDHISAKHGINEITLTCKYCPYITHSKANLKSHIFSLHKLDQHKQCPYCDYHTYQKHRIEIHIDSRHPEHDKKNFSCHHCTRRFIYENSLKTHLNNLKYGPAHVARKKLKRSMNL